MKESFILYGEWEQHFALLSPAQQGALIMALFAYSNREELPEGDPAISMAFSFIRAALDENTARWERERTARSQAGRAGGLAKAGKAARAKGSRKTRDKAALSVSVSESVSASGSPSETEPPSPPSEEPLVSWAENVTMTNTQHDKLLAAYGPADTARLIEILDNYKGATGKQYRDDYRAVLSWCVTRLREERGRVKGGIPPAAGTAPGAGVKADLDWMDRFLEKQAEQQKAPSPQGEEGAERRQPNHEHP